METITGPELFCVCIAVILILAFFFFIILNAAKGKIRFEPAKVYENRVLIAEKIIENKRLVLMLYYPNGSIKQKINLSSNACDHDSQVTVYAENGDLMLRAEIYLDRFSGSCWQKGKINGFYPNGHLKFVGDYTNSGYNGDMKFYYENGDLELILKFKDDKPKKGVLFSPDGLEKELTTAHIYNIINDYGLDNIRVDLSWVKKFYTN